MKKNHSSNTDLLMSGGITVLSTILIGFCFDSVQQGIIAGLLVGLYSYAYSIYRKIESKNSEHDEGLKQSLEKFVSLLKINNEYYEDKWLHGHLERVVSVHSKTVHNKTFLKFAEQEINLGLNGAEELIRGQKTDYSGWKKELIRRRRLKEIVEGSEKYVKAVTSYDPAYWENFWSSERFSKAYTKVNLDAAARGIKVQRIFILPNDVLSGHNAVLSRQMESIVTPMLGKKHLDISFVSSDDLPAPLSDYKKVNFLVSDDLFVGYSNNYSDEKNTKGYVAINMKKEIDSMKEVFQGLSEYAEPAFSLSAGRTSHNKSLNPTA